MNSVIISKKSDRSKLKNLEVNKFSNLSEI